jgi:hypothetical protein
MNLQTDGINDATTVKDSANMLVHTTDVRERKRLCVQNVSMLLSGS